MAFITCANDTDYELLRKHLALVNQVLLEFKEFTYPFVLDFFAENLWEKMPPCWQSLTHVRPQILAQLIDPQVPNIRCNPRLGDRISPLGLLALKQLSISLQVPRQSITTVQNLINLLPIKCEWNEKLDKYLFNDKEVEYELAVADDSPDEDSILDLKDPNNQGKKKKPQKDKMVQHRKHIFTRFVKPKKQHEIFRYSKILDLILRSDPTVNSDIEGPDGQFGAQIVDCGAGLGHLARMLSLKFGHKVVAVDMQSSNTSTATKLDKIATKYYKKNYREEASQRLPSHLQTRLQSSALLNGSSDWEANRYSLVGLHSCGDLSHYMMDHTLSNLDRLDYLFLVSCCYMRATVEEHQMPLSKAFKSLGDTIKWGYTPKEAACHGLEHYVDKLQNDYETLKVHGYRAALEMVIRKIHPDKVHVPMKGVKDGYKLPFEEYSLRMLERGKISIPIEELRSKEVLNCLTEESMSKIVFFFNARVILAPLLETAILLDRILYLYEGGASCFLVPIFKPAESARNNLLIAYSKSKGKNR